MLVGSRQLSQAVNVTIMRRIYSNCYLHMNDVQYSTTGKILINKTGNWFIEWCVLFFNIKMKSKKIS